MPISVNPDLTLEQLRQGWSPRRIGRRILLLPETESTNRAALENAGGPDADGLVVLADYQTQGRGRQGRTWLSPRGASLLCSVLLIEDGRSTGTPAFDPHPAVSPLAAHQQNPGSTPAGWLTLAAAVAACEAIRRATDVSPSLKWPNDLRVRGRKLGGILIESRPLTRESVRGHGGESSHRAWVIGLGINCLQQAGHFPPELREAATSLDLESTHPIERGLVALELLKALDDWLSDPPETTERVHPSWLSFAEPIGQRVALRAEGRLHEGRTVAIDPAGGLIVQLDDGTRRWFDPMVTTLL